MSLYLLLAPLARMELVPAVFVGADGTKSVFRPPPPADRRRDIL